MPITLSDFRIDSEDFNCNKQTVDKNNSRILSKLSSDLGPYVNKPLFLLPWFT